MRGLTIAAGSIVMIVIGFLFFGGPSPAISVAPETLFHAGGLAVTNTMFTSWIVVALLCAVAIIAGRNVSLVPSGFSGVVEAIIAGFYSIVEGVAGEARARQFFWLVATIFFFVITSNYVGLLPGNFNVGKPEAGHGAKPVVFHQTSIGPLEVAYIPFHPETIEAQHGEEAAADAHATPAPIETGASVHNQAEEQHDATSAAQEHAAELSEEGTFPGILAPYLRSVNTDVNTPLAIALYSFFIVEFWGLRTLGPGYLKKFFNFGNILRGKPMGLIDVFVGFLELISEFSRIVSFTFRLFGNIFAGEVVLTMITFLVPLLLINVFYGLELFVGAVQAFVFAMLTLVFAQMAVTSHGDHEGERAAAHE